MIARATALLLAACLPLAAPAAHAAPGDAVRLELTGPGTPYRQVAYAVVERPGAVVASVTKRYDGPGGSRDTVGLLPPDELARLLSELEAMGAFELRDAVGRTPRATWRVSLRRGERTHTFRVDDPERVPDPRYRQVLDRVRAEVRTAAGEVPFRDGRVPVEGSGVLRLESWPRARVTVDGVTLAETTPIEGLRLPAGKHTLRLDGLDEPVTGTYEIQISAGQTTVLRVDLR